MRLAVTLRLLVAISMACSLCSAANAGRRLAEEYQAPRVVGIRSHIPCNSRDRIQCVADGRKARIELELTVLDAIGGDASIVDLPLSVLAPPDFGGPHRVELNDAGRCMRDDLCAVPLDRDWKLTVRVSRQLNVYDTNAQLNNIPMVTYPTETDLTAVGLSHANLTTLPAYGPGVPSLVRGSLLVLVNTIKACQVSKPSSVLRITEAELEAAGYYDPLWADLLKDDFTAEPATGMYLHTCTAVECPALNPFFPTDRLLQLHELGRACSLRSVKELAKPFFEVEVILRNERTGVVHDLYSLHSYGRSQAVYKLPKYTPNGLYEMQMYVKAAPQTRRRGVESATMRGFCGAMFCHDELPRDLETARLQRPDPRLPAGLEHFVTTARHGHEGYLWYPVPCEQMPDIGRSCGQYGAVPESLFRESLSALQSFCYNPGTLEACLRPELSPASVSARLNRYAVNASAPRPAEMLAPRLFNDRRLRTYVATVNPRLEGVVNSGVLDRAIVHETDFTPPDFAKSNHSATDVRVLIEVSDSVLSTPRSNRVKNSVFAQRLDRSGTKCTLRPRSQGDGALLFRYCTAVDLGIIQVGGGRKPYYVKARCSPSIGRFSEGRNGMRVSSFNSSVAVFNLTAPVGGPAGQCTDIGLPLPLATDPALTNTMLELYPDGSFSPDVGVCTLELFDATHDIAIGAVEKVPCFFESGPPKRPLVERHLGEEEPDCTLFSDDPRCGSFVWIVVLAIWAVPMFIILLALAGILLAAVVKSQKAKHMTRAAQEAKKKQ